MGSRGWGQERRKRIVVENGKIPEGERATQPYSKLAWKQWILKQAGKSLPVSGEMGNFKGQKVDQCYFMEKVKGMPFWAVTPNQQLFLRPPNPQRGI